MNFGSFGVLERERVTSLTPNAFDIESLIIEIVNFIFRTNKGLFAVQLLQKLESSLVYNLIVLPSMFVLHENQVPIGIDLVEVCPQTFFVGL
jgi:hypothetical protein